MNDKVRQVISRLTYRKVPFLILYESALVVYFYFSTNPYQRQDVITYGWFFGLGFLFLVPLAIFEKRKVLPLPYAKSMPKYDYFVAGALCFIGTLGFVKIASLLLSYRWIPFQLDQFNPVTWFTIAWNFQFGIIEESMKMALTNFFGIPALFTHRTRLKNLWIFFAGTVSVVFWAYIHLLTGAYIGPNAFSEFLIACVVGMILLTVTIWKRNYLPAVIVHGIYDIGVVFGYWI